MSIDYSIYQRKFSDNKNSLYLDFEGVRIIPGFIEFNDAFEGRTYKQKLHIRNVGRSKVYVRLIPPKSLSYNVKVVKGKFLSPGLCIVREVSFTYNHAALSTSTMAIYVNGKQCDYYLIANISAASSSIDPTYIDFGLMDVCHTSSVRTLTLKNSGTKATRFYVDFTKNENHLIVEPNKGLLHPKSSMTLTIRLISSVEGKINVPLWIKCENPFIVPVTGEVIKPKFEPINVNHTPTYALVDFPITYIGVKSTQTVFVRNYSSVGSMFCFMGEKDEKFVNLKTYKEFDEDFQYFDVFPKDGRCEPKEVKILRFTFEPTKPKQNKKLKPFYFCSFYICRIRCKYLVASDYGGNVFEEEDDVISNCSSKPPTASVSILLDQNSEEYSFVFKPLSFTDSHYKEPKHESDRLMFYLHGVAENPSVIVTPDELTLREMVMGEQQIRVLRLQNESRQLPIIISYRKVPYIILEKETIFLTPLGCIEISVYITSYLLGTINTQIHLDLLYFDQPKVNDEYKIIGNVVVPVWMEVKSVTKFPPIEINKGITPNYIKETGKFCHNITFNTHVTKPKAAMVQPEVRMKKSDALIAFPNDTRQSLRPWRSKLECKTILKRLPRYVPPLNNEYELTAFDKQFRIAENAYYEAYTRQKAKKLQILQGLPEKLVSEYDLTDASKLMCEDIVYPKHLSPKSVENIMDALCVPLSPWQMNNIIISPMVVYTGPIVSLRIHQFDIKVKNENNISISIYVKADRTNIIFPQENRRFIKPDNEVTIPIAYIAPTVGYYTTSLDFIINACMVYVVTIFADVCTSCLKLNTDVINFTDDDTHYYLEIMNPLNADIYFSWLLDHQSFVIEPLDGMVKQRSKLMCHVQYLPHKRGPPLVEVEFYSGDAKPQEVKFIVTSFSMKLSFIEDELVFENMPLNMPVVRKAVLLNKENMLQTFAVVESPFTKFMTVIPSEGLVYGNSHTIITITLKLTSCVNFSTNISFNVTRSGNVDLRLRGNVVFPNISIIPRYIQFKKIPSSSMDVVHVTIENKSDAVASIKFDMHSYKEYKLSESRYCWVSDAEVDEFTLEKLSRRHLYIHFMPNAAASESFILPIIINDILGPLDDNVYGNRTSLFLSERIPDSELEPIPESLPCLKIRSYSTKPKLNISKRIVDLACKASDQVPRAVTEITICNAQDESEKFCIRTENLKPPLQMTYPEGDNIIKYPQSFVCSLEPKESIVIKVIFEPTEFGTYQSVLPLHIKSDGSSKPHNMLILNGIFSAPTITTHSTVLYEKPLPLQNIITALIEFTFKDHFDNCQVTTESGLPKLYLEVVETNYCKDHVKKVVIKMVHEVEERGEYRSYMRVSCHCKAECKVTLIGCVENCFLTTYSIINTFITESYTNMHIKPIRSNDVLQKSSFISESEFRRCSLKDTEYDITGFYTEYPFFPTIDNSFCKFMNLTAEYMEQWIYTQGFYGQRFYKIPEGMNYILFDVKSENKYNKKSSCEIPYIQLLINLVGNRMEKYFDLLNVPSDEIGRAFYCFDIYRRAIDFVRGQGAYLPYLYPHYLLEYSMYRLCVKYALHNHPEQKLFIDTSDINKFSSLSKQCWLDLLLQTYKVFAYYKLKKPDIGVKLKIPPLERFQHSIDPYWMQSNIFSYTGTMLLNWVEFHYNEIRKTVWANNNYLAPRKVTYFGQDLEDGFIYSAVTLAYCPYLKTHFEKLLDNPQSSEEYLHNNIILSLSWKLLNFSIDMHPNEVTLSHAIANCIILSYLYQILPDMYPSETMEFKIGLSCSTTSKFEMKNPNDFPVAYKVSFIGNDENCFEVNNDMLVIKTRSSCQIAITYRAKYMRDVQCILILSGECKNYHYAKSKVLTLIGKPDVTYAMKTVKTRIGLYKCQMFDFEVTSPYSKNASFKLQCTNQQATTVSEINSIPYICNLNRFTLARLFPLDDSIEFNEDNASVVHTIVIGLSTREIPLWIYFRNPVEGDFAVEIITEVEPTLEEDIITVVVPIDPNENVEYNFKELENIHIDIPCQNYFKWEAIQRYMTTALKDEKRFWKKIKNTSTCMHIIQALIQLTNPIYRMELCETKTYKISVQGKPKIKLPQYVTIENECSAGFVSVPIKFKYVKTFPKDFSFLLTSTKGFGIRRYRTNFIYKPLY